MLLCLRPPTGNGDGVHDVWTQHPTPEAAAAALSTGQCGEDCCGAHMIAWGDRGETHVVGPPPPPPPPLDEELAALYQWTPQAFPVEDWPTPPALNPPLDRPANTSPLPGKEDHAALLRNTPAIPPEQPLISTLADETAPAGVVAPPPRCVVAGCELRQYRNSLCENHFWATYPPMPISLPTSVEARFWSHVHKTTGCWLWTGCKTKNGYGSFKVDGRAMYSHHFAYQQTAGPIPKGLRLARRGGCPPHCIRPDHWSPVPPRQIIIDTQRKKKPCPSAAPPAKPESTPTPAPTPPATLPPTHWKVRWTQQPVSSWPRWPPSPTRRAYRRRPNPGRAAVLSAMMIRDARVRDLSEATFHQRQPHWLRLDRVGTVARGVRQARRPKWS